MNDVASHTFLFADLSGFTALTEAHGDEDAADVAGRFYVLARGCLAGGANIVKTIGDAVMVVAALPEDAVRTALRIHGAVNQESGFPDVRSGLHAGPAIERGGDWFGATVNVAARVAAHARSGQILCTEPVSAAARQVSGARVLAAGTALFKNVFHPVALFEIVTAEHVATAIDPVCRMAIAPGAAAATLSVGGRTYCFCSGACAEKFSAAPESFIPPDE